VLKTSLFTLSVLIISGLLLFRVVNAQTETIVPELSNFGAAHELESVSFFNSDQPLRLEHLRGQVVLIEFFTYTCINCIRTIPFVQQWHETYAADGLQVIGVQYPEFAFEHDFDNIQVGTSELGITYPVAIDNLGTTWRAYNQRYWPTIYLIDKTGTIRYRRIGEGAYDVTEAAIRALLAEPYLETTDEPTADTIVYVTPTTELNVRAQPDETSARLGSVTSSMTFIVLEEREDWAQIEYDDSIGWVSTDYVNRSEL